MKNNFFPKVVRPLIDRAGTALASAILTAVSITDPVLVDQITAGIVAVLLVGAELLLGSKREQ